VEPLGVLLRSAEPLGVLLRSAKPSLWAAPRGCGVAWDPTIEWHFLYIIRMITFYLSYKNIDSIEDANIPLRDVELLDLSYNNITSLKGLEKFTNLKYLIIHHNKIKSLSGIEILVNLEFLDISHNKIKSIIEIKKLINLIHLNISKNKIKLLNGIEYLINLEKLCVNDNKIKSLKIIAKLNNLRFLDINNNKIKSVAWIEKLINLKNLYFHNNPLVPIDKYNLIKYIGTRVSIDCGEQVDPLWAPTGVPFLIYNYWQIKKYPQHLKQLVFDYYKSYYTNKYKNELIKNKMIKIIYGLN